MSGLIAEDLFALEDFLNLMVLSNCEDLPIAVILDLNVAEFTKLMLEFVLGVLFMATPLFSMGRENLGV